MIECLCGVYPCFRVEFLEQCACQSLSPPVLPPLGPSYAFWEFFFCVLVSENLFAWMRTSVLVLWVFRKEEGFLIFGTTVIFEAMIALRRCVYINVCMNCPVYGIPCFALGQVHGFHHGYMHFVRMHIQRFPGNLWVSLCK